MGIAAFYIETALETLEDFQNGIDENLLKKLYDMMENGKFKCYDIDKMWDSLHCLLTGVSAMNPIENDLLSESVMGTDILSDEQNYEYIACVYPDRLKKIVEALDKVDTDELGKNFSPRLFIENNIYPDIWMREAEEEIREDLVATFKELKDFYHNVADDGNGIIVVLG